MMAKVKPITEWIDYFMDCFPKMTREESDFVKDILRWNDDKRAAFLLAKELFDSKDEEK